MCDISIIVAVYNHGKYIKQAIESILKQKFSGTYEVLIGEDCSTDNSRDILKELEPMLPPCFHIYFRDYNYGAKKNFLDLYAKMQGKYFIILEGDDFWNYKFKLQKQFDFLEKNDDYIAVAHRVNVVGINSEKLSFSYPDCHHNNYRIIDFINGKMAGQTASIMSRNYFKLHMFNTDINVGEYKAGDRVKLFLMLSHGKIRCIQKKWSSYRYVLVGGDSYCSTHKCKYDEFVPYYKGIYEYSCDEDISNKIKQVSEYMYLWELFKSYMKGKNINYKNEMLRIAKLSNNKMGIFLFFLYKIARFPISYITTSINNYQSNKIKKIQALNINE